MKKLGSVVVFFSLLGLFFIVWNVRFLPKARRVLECKPESLSAIRIEKEKETYSLETDENGKSLQRYGDHLFLADKGVLRGFKNLLCHIPYVERFPITTEEDFKVYGFDPSQASISLTAGATLLLTLGAMSPAGTEFFLMSSLSPKEVFVIPNRFYSLLKPDWMEFRSRFPFGESNFDTLQLRYFEDSFSLKFSGNTWVESDGRFQPETAKEIIALLKGLEFKNFHGPMNVEQTKQYGFFLPEIDLVVGADKYQIAKSNGKVYLSETMPDGIYLLILDNYVMERLDHLMRQIITAH